MSNEALTAEELVLIRNRAKATDLMDFDGQDSIEISAIRDRRRLLDHIESQAARIAELERDAARLQNEHALTIMALRPFAVAHDHARHRCANASLGVMDANDYFMWQANRRLCAQNFIDAKKRIDAIDAVPQEKQTP